MGPVEHKVARPIGLLEGYSTSRHSLGFYRCVGQTARYNVPVSSLGGRDLASVIEHAIAQTILAHPVLQAGIVGEDTKSPSFISLPSLDLSQHIKWEHIEVEPPANRDAALQRVLEARHSSLWPDLHRRPGYEFIILSPNPTTGSSAGTLSLAIVFAVHHAYADGNSGVILQQTLSKALNNPTQVPSLNPSSHILTIPTPSPLPPVTEALITFQISWSFLLKSLWAEFGPSFLKPTPPSPAWAGNKPITLEPHDTRIRIMSFPTTTASDIFKRCRAKSATLTPVLHVLVLHSLATRLPDDAVSDHRTLTSTTPISLRRLIPPGGKMGFDPDTSMGVIVVSTDHQFSASTIRQIRAPAAIPPSDESLVWELSSSLGDDLRRKVASLPKDDITGLMGWISDYREWFRKKLGTPRQTTWEVSNVGAAGFASEDSGWSVDRLVFSQSASVTGAAFSVNVAGVKGGELAVSIAWQEGIVDEELVDGVAGDLKKWLAGFATTGRFGFAA